MMNRRSFLKSLVTGSALVVSGKSLALLPDEKKKELTRSERKKILKESISYAEVNILFMNTHKNNGIDYLHGTAQLENDESTKKSFCFMIDPNVECDNDNLLQQMKSKLYLGLNNEYNGDRQGAYYSPNTDFVLGIKKRVIVGFSI